MSDNALCWQKGKIMPASEASVSVMDHGLLYGDGVFEGIRFYQRCAFYLDSHLRRLRDSAQAICLQIPLNDEQLKQAIEQLIVSFALEDGYIRLLVTRGAGSLGISPVSCSTPEVIIIVDEIDMVSPDQRNRGIKAVTAATRRLSADGLSPRIKSLNYLNHILARLEAHNAGAQEAFMLNAAGNIAEGSTDNVFIVRDGLLVTPPLSDGPLNGVTRGIIIALAKERSIDVRESSITTYDVYTADECFVTGTGAELIPVYELDGRALRHCPGPVFDVLSQAFIAHIREQVSLAEAV